MKPGLVLLFMFFLIVTCIGLGVVIPWLINQPSWITFYSGIGLCFLLVYVVLRCFHKLLNSIVNK